jgi:protein ImuA
MSTPPSLQTLPGSTAWPALAEGLEEVCAGATRDMAGAFVFALSRLPEGDGRPVLLAANRLWSGEYGRPYGPGFRASGLESRDAGLILAEGRTEGELLWIMEQALRSGAVSAALATVEAASLAQTRRLEFAARDGAAAGIVLRRTEGGLSAARRRWRITTLKSMPNPDDDRAPGGFALRAELTRSRAERPGAWKLEQDDETHRLRLADRLAGDGLGERGRTGLAA